MIGWKVLTHDLRPPIQGGEPLFDGTTPHKLPPVRLDRSDQPCAAGWNFCRDLSTALRIAGFVPNGRPATCWQVRSGRNVVERVDKCRARSLTIVRPATEAEMEDAVFALSQGWFGDLADEMTREQMAWRHALTRPRRDRAAVEAGLRTALDARGLGGWKLREFQTARATTATWAARDARDAWDAWATRAARAARATLPGGGGWAARDARDAWDAWATRAAWAAWAAGAPWAPGAVGAVGAAWAARDARDALGVYYAARRGRVDYAPDRLTVGLRDAYTHGLGIAIPTGPQELGWAMDGEEVG